VRESITPDETARRKLLWDLSIERRTQARHSENLRSTVTGFIVTASSILTALVTWDKFINRTDVALTSLIMFIGIIGLLFCGSYTERYHRNRKRASDLLKELDLITTYDGVMSTQKIEANADQQTWSKKRFALFRKLGSSHWLWLAFPAMVSILGIGLTLMALLCSNCSTAH
jgi:hypothetical protein